MTTRRTLLLSTAAPIALAACGAPATQTAPAAKPATGKVVVLSYQSSSPRLDLQIAMYQEAANEFKPKGLEIEFVPTNSAADTDVMTKALTFHAAGTPADMF